MEDEVRIGDHVRYYSSRLGVALNGTVVEINGDSVKSKLDTPIEYFTVDKHNLYRIKEGSNGDS